MKFSHLLILIAVISMLSACATGVGGPAPVIGAKAPEFSAITLDGVEVKLSDSAGQPVLINFWATWCGPCRLEMPYIDAAAQQHSELVVLALDLDESPQAVADYAFELQLTFEPVLDVGGKISTLYQVRGYPSSFFVDSEGIIRAVHLGAMSANQITDYLAEIGLEN